MPPCVRLFCRLNATPYVFYLSVITLTFPRLESLLLSCHTSLFDSLLCVFTCFRGNSSRRQSFSSQFLNSQLQLLNSQLHPLPGRSCATNWSRFTPGAAAFTISTPLTDASTTVVEAIRPSSESSMWEWLAAPTPFVGHLTPQVTRTPTPATTASGLPQRAPGEPCCLR